MKKQGSKGRAVFYPMRMRAKRASATRVIKHIVEVEKASPEGPSCVYPNMALLKIRAESTVVYLEPSGESPLKHWRTLEDSN